MMGSTNAMWGMREDLSQLFTLMGTPSPELTSVVDIAGISENGEYIVCLSNRSPYVIMFKRTGNTIARLPDMEFPSGFINARDVSISNDGVYLLLLCHREISAEIEYEGEVYPLEFETDSLVAYKRNGDTYSPMDTLYPTDPIDIENYSKDIFGCAISGDGNFACLLPEYGPVGVFKRNNDKYIPLALHEDVHDTTMASFSYDGTYLVCNSYYDSKIFVSKLSENAYDLIDILNDDALGYMYDCSLSQDGNCLAVSSGYNFNDSWPTMTLHKRSRDAFEIMPNPTSLTNMEVPEDESWVGINGCAFSGDASLLAVLLQFEPYLKLFKLNNGAYKDLKFTEQLEMGARSCKISSDGNYMALAFSQAPYIKVFKRGK